MSRPFSLDLSGKRFGRWLVLSKHGRNQRGEVSWLCRCDCGEERPVKAGSLGSGKSVSCGCYHRDERSTHGMTRTPTFRSWESMKQRCLNPSDPSYGRYGGRGIKVCGQWANSFDQFLCDMGERPAGMTLDRIENDGDYEPSNCRWANLKTQQRNRRCMPTLTVNGETKTYPEWFEQTGIRPAVIAWRLAKQWPPERIITEPVRPKRADGTGRSPRRK